MKETETQRQKRSMSGNDHVRVEMQTFLEALASYADRVSRDPNVSFEEYHSSLMTPAPSGGSGSRPAAKAAAQGR
jgi:hypothetical protein